MSDAVSSSSSVTGSSGASSVGASSNTLGAGGKAQPNSSTTISSMEEMRVKHPELYQKVLLSMAQNMCIQINRKNQRVVEEMKKLRREGRG